MGQSWCGTNKLKNKSKNFKHKVKKLTSKEVEDNRCKAYKYLKL